MTIKKDKIWKYVLILYIVLSLAYILNSLWNTILVQYGQRSFNQGREATIEQLIQQSQQCEPFSVYNTEQEVQLINVSCLEKTKTEEQAEAKTKQGE